MSMEIIIKSNLFLSLKEQLSVDVAMKVAIMESLGDLEILAEAHSVWEIKNYSKLPHRSHAPEFECGGFKW